MPPGSPALEHISPPVGPQLPRAGACEMVCPAEDQTGDSATRRGQDGRLSQAVGGNEVNSGGAQGLTLVSS